MGEIKCRAWDIEMKHMVEWDELEQEWEQEGYFDSVFRGDHYVPMLYVGLTDNKNKEYYEGDIGQFDNGDTFVIRREDWIEFYVAWIGAPECEDQARDFYRIRSATKIGNEYENPEMITLPF